ncbi:MAG: hypothetical protein CMB76_07010 [Euryarchaeota archaeon]|nr:hypothetical protein [Euryarchaeota archaeon]
MDWEIILQIMNNLQRERIKTLIFLTSTLTVFHLLSLICHVLDPEVHPLEPMENTAQNELLVTKKVLMANVSRYMKI